MLAVLHQRLDDIGALCRRFGVARLDLFGSAARGDFDPARSDLDFLVAFTPEARSRAFDNYFGLREGLEALLGRKIDLVTDGQLRNPYLASEIEATRRVLYSA